MGGVADPSRTARRDGPRTYRLVVAYDGRGFHGAAVQPGLRTVCGELATAVERALGASPVALALAGRTDAGVHARGQVVSFRLRDPVDADALAARLRPHLPADVRLCRVEEVPRSFHARNSAKLKLYRYRLVETPGEVPPGLQGRAWAVPGPVDVAVMAALARALEGTRDFTALRHPRCQASSPVREVRRVRVKARSLGAGRRLVVVDVVGVSFLRGMVRNLVGALVEVGTGRMGLEEVVDAVARADPGAIRRPAPAHGLTLWRVET
jgi:tRNA pseudouridine38-40 synthase